jgi:hypothetical protein
LFFFFWELFFFLTPHVCPGLTYLHLDYLPMHPGLLPPPPTYLPAHLPNHLPTYLCTYTLNLHQANDNEGIPIY